MYYVANIYILCTAYKPRKAKGSSEIAQDAEMHHINNLKHHLGPVKAWDWVLCCSYICLLTLDTTWITRVPLNREISLLG